MATVKIPKYKVVNSITRKGYPTASKYYREAHSEASNAEKKAFPKGYVKLKKLTNSKKFPANKLAATHTKNGKVMVAKKAGSVNIPKKFDREEALHEIKELQADKRLRKDARRKSKKS